MGTLHLAAPEVAVSAQCVLFVDDEEGFLELYRAAFGREGYAVETTATADAARDRLERGGIDLVVLDIRLGEASGLSLLREIKARDAAIPVVLSTAYARYQDDFSSWLADAYVVKSSDLSELRQAVRRCLGQSR
jgi:DNA-binding NtrC family response regulator